MKKTIYFYKGNRFKVLNLAESHGISTRLGKLQKLFKEGLNIEDAMKEQKLMIK